VHGTIVKAKTDAKTDANLYIAVYIHDLCVIDWGKTEEDFLEALNKTKDEAVLRCHADKLQNPNAFHAWRDVSTK
jgi:hypothetical protein